MRGEGAIVAIAARAMADLEAMCGNADAGALVFNLSASQINRRMAALRAPLTLTMNEGHWLSCRMVVRYTRNENAGAALAYLC